MPKPQTHWTRRPREVPASRTFAHEMPFGAELAPDGRVHFRVWAPAQAAVSVEIGGSALVPMQPLAGGWHSLTTAEAAPGAHYRFRLNDGLLIADPASRRQAGGVDAASVVVDPRSYQWQHPGWAGREWASCVLYELHVGTFTPEGTFAAAQAKLPYLAKLGVTAIELMPIAAFPGTRSWGYDGVLLFAPASCYGSPDELKALVDAAHGLGLAVILDVVYNHFGPHGNYLTRCAPQFFTERHQTPWGAAINFDDGDESAVVREFIVQNALYWTGEYRFDGLRLDAVHAICDDSSKHVACEVVERTRAAAPGRRLHFVLENEDNGVGFLERDGNGGAVHFDAQWNDDVHHVLHAAVTDERSGYYEEYHGDTARLGRAIAEGFAFQGERMEFRGTPRGEPSAHLPPTAFVAFLQNHDQVGNRAFGERIGALATRESVRAATAVYLLLPQIPMLFMGEEWEAAQPFQFFTDLPCNLADAVRDGRRAEFARFAEFADPAQRERIPDPQLAATFAASQLRWRDSKFGHHAESLERYRRLIAVRRREIVPRLAAIESAGRYCEHGKGGILVQWIAGREVLTLAANLAPERARLVAAPGRELWREGEIDANGDCGPWAVRWTID